MLSVILVSSILRWHLSIPVACGTPSGAACFLCSKSLSPHFSQRDYIEGGKRRGYFHLDDPGGSALLSRRQRGNWTPMAAIRLCTSQCPIRRRSDSLVADSADNPQIARLNHRLQFVGAEPTPVGIA